ncbi:hypothetical protein B296_00010348 [Ensete ventricosum]|uniref:Secreted protein n=1 Tax=Ensete ventricosum TaxID=4639 RepID=A0A426ZWF1_ENSVE|nr:hypothetical protein B296_00010348 [Ensete ventricosum]
MMLVPHLLLGSTVSALLDSTPFPKQSVRDCATLESALITSAVRMEARMKRTTRHLGLTTPRLTSSMTVAVLCCSSFDGEGSLLPRLRPFRSPSKRENRQAKRGTRACMNPRDLRFLSPVARSVLTSISVTRNRML